MTAAHLIPLTLKQYRNQQAVLHDIEVALAAGRLKATAGTCIRHISSTNQPFVADYAVPDRLWKTVAAEGCFEQVWNTGSVLIPRSDRHCETELSSIVLDDVQLARLLEAHDMSIGILTAGKRGRATYDHGYPVALLVLDLLRKGRTHIQREKAESLVPQLQDLYTQAGASRPNPRNAAGIASGVLRALRSADDFERLAREGSQPE